MVVRPYDSAQWRRLRPVIYERDHGICQLCGKRLPFEGEWDIDHKIPTSEGGPMFDPHNLRLSCWSCNRGRNAKRQKLAAKINRTPASAPSRRWR